MSDNFADKYFKADICSSAGLREQPIVRLLSEFKNGINYELRRFGDFWIIGGSISPQTEFIQSSDRQSPSFRETLRSGEP